MPTGLLRLHIPAMDCAAEESEIRRALQPLAGIRALHVDLGQRVLGLDVSDAADEGTRAQLQREVQALLQRLGMPARVLADEASTPPPAAPGLGRLAAALALALGAELLHALWPEQGLAHGAGLAVAALAILLAGASTYRKGLAALRQGRLNINALMTVAVSGAFAIGQWPEAAMVMALYALAERLEAGALQRSRRAVRALLDLAPPQAEVRQADGRWQVQPSATVQVGDVLRIRPGARVPLDGQILVGHSALDEAPVTGESLPRDKGPGEPVYAGSINGAGELELRVVAGAADSTLARILHAVERAQASRAPLQGVVDRFAAVYTPAVFMLALGVALLAPWLLGWNWSQAIYQALVLLVIACPCALVISTPVSLVSALAASARRGVLVKGGLHLEQARRLRVVALDKTGTLTEGKPRLVAFEPLPGLAPAEVRSLALALAQRSDHPLAQALAAGLAPQGAAVGLPTLVEVQALPGRGVQACINGQRGPGGRLRLASPRWAAELGLMDKALQARLAPHEAAGRSLSLLLGEHGVLAIAALADGVRPQARAAVQALRAMGLHTVMLSGDQRASAASVAAELGLDEWRAPLLPQDKLDALSELRRHHGPIAMVGDGINDAPALAQADLGLAMGAAGTDVAMEAADVVVMNDELGRLPELLRLSRRTHAVLWQNITVALGIKLVFLVAALGGHASMWMAVFADVGASLLVVANGLRLLRAAR